MTMENKPFEDVFPIENGDIPASYVSLPECIFDLTKNAEANVRCVKFPTLGRFVICWFLMRVFFFGNFPPQSLFFVFFLMFFFGV